MRIVLLACVGLVGSSAAVAADEPSARDLFARRIVPLLSSPDPSSCRHCHLAGVELKDYFLNDSDKSFRSLRDQGLIDLDAPDQSKLLALIARGKADDSPKGKLAAKVANAEHDAISQWIAACIRDAALKSSPALDAKERPTSTVPVEVIRHARTDRLLESFERNVWAWRFRCMNCHAEGTPQGEKNREKHGDFVVWMKKDGAKATMDGLLASKLINVKSPDQSKLLRKPLGEDDHGGGVKFALGDQGYAGFRKWIEDVAAIRNGHYQTVKDLPAKELGPMGFGTEYWFKLSNTPDAWAGKLLRLEIVARKADGSGWESEPIATSDRLVAEKGNLWQHTLTLLAPRGSDRAKAWAKRAELPNGPYLLRVSIDSRGKLVKDWKAKLDAGDFAGETSFDARWRTGYGSMTIVDARTIKKP
jgi:hypothetical protein